jgi:hypothetical protein
VRWNETKISVEKFNKKESKWNLLFVEVEKLNFDSHKSTSGDRSGGNVFLDQKVMLSISSNEGAQGDSHGDE